MIIFRLAQVHLAVFPLFIFLLKTRKLSPFSYFRMNIYKIVWKVPRCTSVTCLHHPPTLLGSKIPYFHCLCAHFHHFYVFKIWKFCFHYLPAEIIMCDSFHLYFMYVPCIKTLLYVFLCLSECNQDGIAFSSRG